MSGSNIEIHNNTVSKYGKRVNLNEAETIKFIKENTTIPVPNILEYYTKDGKNYIVMDRIDGKTLESELSNLNAEELENILLELKGYVNQMRNITSSYIGSIHNKPLNDVLFQGGPFYSEQEFNQHMIDKFKDILRGHYHTILAKMLKNNHKIVFTHADINPRNILIKNNKIIGIIDWEFSGFYPEYWEYIRSMFGIPWDNKWLLCIEKVIEPYYYENAVFNIITKAFF